MKTSVECLWNDTGRGKQKINVNFIYRFSPYSTVNTSRLGYKNQLVLYERITAVCYETHENT
jgi:hypothetical protein